MKVEITVPEVIEIFNEIQKKPEALFEMIRLDLQQTVGEYLTAVMRAELTHFLDRMPYERCVHKDNHRNGSYRGCKPEPPKIPSKGKPTPIGQTSFKSILLFPHGFPMREKINKFSTKVTRLLSASSRAKTSFSSAGIGRLFLRFLWK